MADVIEHWNKEGVITFQSTDPMNEPATNYWGANSNKQEGCHFSQGESQSKILVALNEELKNKGINIIISGTDETNSGYNGGQGGQIDSYNKLSDEAKAVLGRIDTHTYTRSSLSDLSALAQSEGKNLWMSEVDGSYTAGTKGWRDERSTWSGRCNDDRSKRSEMLRMDSVECHRYACRQQ